MKQDSQGGEPAPFSVSSPYFSPYEDNLVSLITDEYIERAEKLKTERTGWTLANKLHISFPIQKVHVLPSGTYVSIPQEITIREAIINVNNYTVPNSNRCFL